MFPPHETMALLVKKYGSATTRSAEELRNTEVGRLLSTWATHPDVRRADGAGVHPIGMHADGVQIHDDQQGRRGQK